MKTRFNVGDRVRLVNPPYHGLCEGAVGTIAEKDCSSIPYFIEFDCGSFLWFEEGQLEEAESEWDVEDLL